MRNFKRVLSFLLVLIMLVGMVPSLGINIAAAGVTVTLNAGPEGNGKTCTVTLDDAGTLLTDKAAIKSNYNGIAPKGTNNQRVLIGWFTGYDSTTSRGTGTEYWDTYTGESGVTLYAIWGYPIMFNSNGGTYSNGESTYLGYVANYNATNYSDPKSSYSKAMPDYLGDIPVKPGCERVMYNGDYAYALLNNDGTWLLWEGPNQNLTIPPTGGSQPWSDFVCTYSEKYKMNVPEFWAGWDFTVSYNANGGTGSMSTDTVEFVAEWCERGMHYYEDYSIKDCAFTKSGATFTGWNTKADGSGISYGVGHNLGGQRDSSDPVTLYAQWDDPNSGDGVEGEYKVILDPNGGTVSKGSSYGTVTGGKLVCSATPGKTYKEIIGSLPTPTRSGYIFEGWWYQQDDPYYDGPYLQNPGKGWFLDLNANYIIPKDVTFEAKWIENPTVKSPNTSKKYKMTFDPNGGTLIGPSVYYINNGDTYYSIFGSSEPVAYRKGYSLEGWFDTTYNYHLRTEYTSEKYAVTSASTWVAKWTKINEHSCVWTTISSVSPTCTEAGSNYQGCFCGADRTVAVKATGHKFNTYYGIYSQATCTENRFDIYRCDVCDATENREAADTALGHDWSETWYHATAEDKPQCEVDGVLTADCMRIGCNEVTTKVDPAIGHNYVGTVIPAYCECEETMLYVCQNDPEHWYEEVTGNESALGHLFDEPYDNGEGYTVIECIRESDGTNPECPHEVKTANRYNIIYDLVLPTATFGANTPMYHTYDTETVLVEPTANATFLGWYYDREYTQPVSVIGGQEHKAPIKLYAKWEIKIELYSATTKHHLYDDEGNSLGEGKNTTITVVYGEDIRIPYRWWNNTNVFNGWTNAAIETLGQNAVIPAYTFSENARLTASYAVNKFPIVYHDVTLGGDITADTEYITNGDKLTQSITYNSTSKNITVVAPLRTGYVATMYKTLEAAQSGTGAFTVINQNSITSNNYTNNQIDVYVVWTVNSKTLTLGRTVSTAYFIVDEAGTKQTTARTVTHTYDKDTILKKDVSPTLSADFIDMYYQGYEFVGWNSGTTYNAGTRYSEDMFKIPANSVPMAEATTIYAEWKPNEFIVEYVIIDAQTGEHIVLTDENAASYGVTNWDKITDAMKTHTFGVASARIPTLARSGYTMTKWFYADNTALNGTYKDQLGAAATYYNSPYHADNPKVELREDGKYYIVVHATATLNAGYKITLGVNGGKFVLDGVEDTTSRTVTHTTDKDTILNTTESNLSKDFDTIYKIGYDFVGWNNGTAYNAGIRYSSEMHKIPKWSVPVADILYAEWKPNTFPIEYYIDGVLLTEDNYESLGMTKANFDSITAKHTHTYGTATANLVAPVRTGYTMSTWSYTPGGAAISGQDIPATYCSYDANGRDYVIKVYATSTPNKYTHRMYPNSGTFTLTAGGTATSYKTFTTTYNEVGDLTTLFTALERPGYTFIGWNTVGDGTGDYISYDMFSIPANSIAVADYLYAVWQPDTFPIEYYVDGVLLTEESAKELGVVNYEAILAKNVHKNGTATADLVRVQRTGYTSTANWSFDPSGAPVISGHDIPAAYCTYDTHGRDFVIKVYSVTTPDDVRIVYRTPDGTSVGAGNLNAYFGIDNAWPMVDYDQTYVLPTETYRTGYHLAGLYSDTACKNRIYEVNPADFITTYNQGATYTDYNVYVKWEKDETTPPTGSIDLGVGSAGESTEFIGIEEIRYGIYSNNYDNIVITGEDTNYVAPTVEYYLSNRALTLTQVEALTEWTSAPNGEAFALPEGTADGEYVIYVKLTDDQGNVSYISSQRFVYDTTAPVFDALADGEYCFDTEDLGKQFKVEEKYLYKFTVNGESVALDSNDTYTLAGSEEGAEYVVYAVDKAGNETKVTVKIYNCHDWSDAVYTWAEDVKSCSAFRVCNRATCGIEETADAVVTSEITVPATCEEMGTTTYTATFAVDWAQTQTIEREDVDAIGHDWSDASYIWAEDGKSCDTKRVCANDASHVEIAYEKIKVEITVPATCMEMGTTTYTATFDLDLDWVEPQTTTRVDIPVDPDAHLWDEGVVTAPTCTAEGYTTYTCQHNAEHTKVESFTDMIPHTEGTAVKENIIEATCTTDGSYESVVYCTVCNTELSRVKEKIAALGHTKGEYVVEIHEDATCEANGSHIEVMSCTVCGEELDRTVQFLPKLGHDYEVTEHKDASCVEDGYDVYTCKNDEAHTYTVVLTKLGHDEVYHEAQAPTCTEIGWDAYVTCSRCDYTTYSEIPAAAHKYDAVVTEPTCETDGYTTYICEACGDSYVSDEVDALGHTPAQAVEEERIEAQCGIPGSYDMVVYCVICKEELSRENFEIPALTCEFTFTFDAENGDGYVKCQFCGEAYNGFFLDEETGNYYYAQGNEGKTTEGLFVVDGYYYYGLADEYGNLVCDDVYMITFAEKEVFNAANAEYALNGRNSCYSFGSDYRIVPDGFVTGQMYRDTIADDPYAQRTFCYENYQLVIGLRLFEEGDSMVYRYFNDWHGFMYQNTRLWISDFENAEEGASGHNPYGLPHGYYNFDENGIMIMPEGYAIVTHNGRNYLTLDGVKQSQGLYEIETGKYVYVKSGKTVAQNECQWLTDATKKGLIGGINCFYYFSEDFTMELNCFVEISGKTYYINEKAEALLGFNKIGNDYYFFNAKSGLMYKDTVLWVGENPYGVKVENHYFMEDGKMFVDTGVFAPVLTEENGNLYITIDGVKQYYGLFEIDGDLYFAQGSGIVAVDTTVWVSNTNDLVESKGYYRFDEEGKMVRTGFMTTSKGYTYYYDNGVLAKGFTKIGDHYYLFNASSGMMYHDATMWIGANNAYGFAAGYYYFDAEGKLFVANEETGVKKVICENGYYYFTIDNVKQINGIYELDGDYYYAKADGKLYTSITLYLSDAVAAEFGGTVGYYAFDSEAKIVKNGFVVASNGNTYYYDDLVRVKGLTRIGEDIYLFNNGSGMMYTDYKAWIGADNALDLPYGYYYFGADGKCTGKVS